MGSSDEGYSSSQGGGGGGHSPRDVSPSRHIDPSEVWEQVLSSQCQPTRPNTWADRAGQRKQQPEDLPTVLEAGPVATHK